MNEQLYANAEKMLRVLDEGGIDVIREMGIKGQVSDPFTCLVARYLNETVGGGGEDPSDGWVVGGSEADCRGAGIIDMPIPRNVQQLIDDFDSHAYPELEL